MWSIYHHVRDNGGQVFEGGSSVEQATYLREFARRSGAKVIAEIGFNVGFSSLAFLEGSPDTRVVSFELDARRSVQLAKEFIDTRYPGRHELVVGDSTETVAGYAGAPCDLVFVDGGHTYEIAAADIRNARRIARHGGLVVVDDLIPWYPWGIGPHRAWQEAIELGLIEPTEYLVDGRVVDEIAAPGGRAWGAGRFLGHPASDPPGITAGERATGSAS
ncbi:O-methyltransferase [Herbihabitans rhizosphaerae]|nr:class I SAM-dependent methyltransferase [Herbihabitans rhizosphaerae]